jgi:hypothetical protein
MQHAPIVAVPWRPVLIGAALLVLGGCAVPESSSGYGAHVLSYTLEKVETSIDPKTGYIVRIAHWRYEDGATTTTTDTTLPSGDNERRRNPPNPPPRVGD